MHAIFEILQKALLKVEHRTNNSRENALNTQWTTEAGVHHIFLGLLHALHR